jgi:nitrate reductase (cytochrome), electron transfer subunit
VKSKKLLYIGLFIFVFALAIGVTVVVDGGNGSKVGSEQDSPILVQLEEEGRPDAETMGLVGAPPMKPANHIDRWVPELRHQGCLTCHQNVASGAPKPTADHYYFENQDGEIFRDNCIQCHAYQSGQQTVFNSEK